MDILKVLEKQSGFLRLISYLYDSGELPLTSILKETEIPVHQLYSSIEKARELKLVKTRIDRKTYPAKNLVSLTEKGKKLGEEIKEIVKIIESD